MLKLKKVVNVGTTTGDVGQKNKKAPANFTLRKPVC